MVERLHIGTSGWNYDGWKDGFYKGVPRSKWLEHYARHFRAVEVNATFYREQTPETFERWRDTTPADFRFAIKGHKYITHNKKLIDPDSHVERQRASASVLGGKLGAVVWQLPGFLRKDIARLAHFAEVLSAWPDAGQAIEFRHASWFTPEVAAILGRQDIGVCISDAASWPMWDTTTSCLVYIRLHGHDITYYSAYSPESIGAWAARIRTWLLEGRTVHVYFDNTDAGAAVRDASALAELFF